MKCSVCTQAVADNAPFCPFCGHVFDEARTEQERVTMVTGDAPAARDPVVVANREGEKALTIAIVAFFLFAPLLLWSFILARRSAATLEHYGEPPNRLGTIALWLSGIMMAMWAIGIIAFATLFIGLGR